MSGVAKQCKQEGRVLLPSHVVPVRYEVQLVPDLKAFIFQGTCHIKFNIDLSKLNDENKNVITLHAKELCISSAQYVVLESTDDDSSTVPATPVSANEIALNVKATSVQFKFEQAIPVTAKTILVTINYMGYLNNQMAGFYRSEYTNMDGAKKIMASTQFESLDARRCFPCVDEPGAKAIFAVQLTVDAMYDVLSNMPISCKHMISPTTKVVSFLDTPIMSTYLLAICVGEFDMVQTTTSHGVIVSVYTPPGKSHMGQYALHTASKALSAYDDFFQVPYPLPKLDMIAIPEFAMGAMENWGLVTYREVDLLIDPITASSNQKQRVATVVTHELAHQWFGNLVTMQWWDDLWLNEGFASWAENWAADQLYPDYAMWDQFTTGHLSSALRLDALKSSHPIQVPIHHAEEVEQVFDAISYCKGGSVVRMIKAVLGTKNFQTGLANYMKKYAYGNTETVDLWTAWEDVSQMPVNEMMASWTEQMGFPLLKVVGEEWSADKVILQLEQFWFLSDGSPLDDEGAAKRWTIPILTCTNDGSSSDMTLMRDKTASITVSLKSSDSWVKLNAKQEVPMRVYHSTQMLDRLAVGIKNKSLSAIDRAALVNDAYALVKAGHQSPESLIHLLVNFSEEEEYIVWQGLADTLSGLYVILSDSDELCSMFESFAKSMVVKLMKKVGWEVQKSDGHLTTLLRGIMIGLLSTFAYNDEAVIQEATTRFAAFQIDPKDVQNLPSDMRTAVFAIILKNGGEKEYNIIKSYFYSADNNAEKKHVLSSVGSISDPKLKLATMKWSVSGDIKLQDFFYPMGSVGRSKRIGREIAWKFFQDNFVTIKRMIANASSSLMDACIVMCAGGFCTTEKADEIDAFFAANPVPSSTRKIAQLTESMRANAKFLDLILASELSSKDFWNNLK